MSLGIRKIIVISLIGIVLLSGNILMVANWLADQGIPERANWIKDNFLTGTTVAITVVLLILLVNPKTSRSRIFSLGKSCPVCDSKIGKNSNYCSECGSKVA